MRQILALIILGCFYGGSLAQSDIIGCGGFIKSDVPIDYSVIEVKLYTRQGSLKYQTDCAPHNGYYMMPVYETGEYVLKVEPPTGWKFEPEEIPLTVDGVTDPCTLSKDLDFTFTGFGLIGQVVSVGANEGPSGVHLDLLSKDNKVIQSSKTEEHGRYKFVKVLPGTYTVKATSKEYAFAKASVQVTVDKVTGDASSAITIKGYDIQGSVLGERQSGGDSPAPQEGVAVLLFSAAKGVKAVDGCTVGKPTGFEGRVEGHQAVCHTASDGKGRFVFRGLPVGSYTLVPFYRTKATSFLISPAQQTVDLSHSHSTTKEPFSVVGFSVKGRVTWPGSRSAEPIVGARVRVKPPAGSSSAEEVVTTGSDGWFTLAKMTSASYTIGTEAPGVGFDDVIVQVSSSSPVLTTIVPSRFDVCGRIVIDKAPEGVRAGAPREVLYYRGDKKDGAGSKVATKQDGSFCVSLPKGTFSLEAVVSDSEKRYGLQLSPRVRTIEVKDKPLKDVIFSQFTATVNGLVTCLETCLPSRVVLESTDKKIVLTANASPSGNKAMFQFSEVIPGQYTVYIRLNSWCWESQTADLEVEGDTTVTFRQNGYALNVNLSHKTTLTYTKETNDKMTGELSLSPGHNKACLPEKGMYRLTPSSCHQFDKDAYTFDTANMELVTMTAVKHRAVIRVSTDRPAKELVLTIREEGAEDRTFNLETKSSSGAPYIGTVEHMARKGSNLIVTVTSNEFIFETQKQGVSVSDSCPGADLSFTGVKGQFIEGLVTPSVSGAAVTVTPEGPHADGPVTQTVIDKNGRYKVGPLPPTPSYSVNVTMEGYIFTPMDKQPTSFKAFRLAAVDVQVVDEAGQPLQGVLLSLSGGQQYRSNKVSQEQPITSFPALHPGQYFLKPMMKEYSFQPPSVMVPVEEGRQEKVKVVGVRVSFSSLGSVTSLAGDPEPGVTMEAVGIQDDKEGCSGPAEEAVTDSDGNFRIRGLKPGCTYEVQLKKSGNTNPDVQRVSPAQKSVLVGKTDSNAGRFFAFGYYRTMEVSVHVDCPSEHLSSVKMKLYSEENSHTAMHTLSMSAGPVVYFPALPRDGQRYILTAESTLSKRVYNYTLPQASFTADRSTKHFSFTFKPERGSFSDDARGGPTLIPVLLVILVAITYAYRETVIPYLQEAVTSMADRLLHGGGSEGSESRGRRSGRSAALSGTQPTDPGVDMSIFDTKGQSERKKGAKVRSRKV